MVKPLELSIRTHKHIYTHHSSIHMLYALHMPHVVVVLQAKKFVKRDLFCNVFGGYEDPIDEILAYRSETWTLSEACVSTVCGCELRLQSCVVES